MKETKFRSYTIKIDDSSGSEQLSIDDKPVPFHKGIEGYSIFYNLGHPTLLAAAKAYLKTQS